jgi:capsular polysaccharide biosynthesis protein
LAIIGEGQAERLNVSVDKRYERRRLMLGVLAGVLVAIAIVGAGAAAVLSRPARWSAQSTLVVLPAKNIDLGAAASYYDTLSRGQIVSTLAEILHLAQVVNSASDQTGLSPSLRRMTSVSVTVVPNTALVAVTASAPNAQTAERLADAVAQVGQTYIAGLGSPYTASLVSKASGTGTRNGLGLSKLLTILVVAALAAGLGTQQAVYQLYPLVVRRRKSAVLPPPSSRIPTAPIDESPMGDRQPWSAEWPAGGGAAFEPDAVPSAEAVDPRPSTVFGARQRTTPPR